MISPDKTFTKEVPMENQSAKPLSGRIYLIDHLKAISVMMVIFTHYAWKDKTGLFFTLIIAMAVPIFMVISGFNFTMSYERKTDGSLRELYAPSQIFLRLYRFLLPFVIVYIPEMILHIFIRKETYTPKEWLLHFIEGGLGPGSYYVPVLVVMLFCFPLIYICIRRFSYLGVAFIGLIHLAYEIYVRYGHMDKYYYRLLFFRYLLFVAFGCYMYFHFQNKKKYPISKIALFLMFCVGLSFSVAVYQFHWKPPIFRYWTKTAMPLALYIFPIVFLLIAKFGQKNLTGGLWNLLAKIGQASYHIFLIQMIYYRLFDDLVLPAGPAIPVVIGNLAITLVLGYLYYLLESKLSKKILQLFQK